jgi:hypothetical protein
LRLDRRKITGDDFDKKVETRLEEIGDKAEVANSAAPAYGTLAEYDRGVLFERRYRVGWLRGR